MEAVERFPVGSRVRLARSETPTWPPPGWVGLAGKVEDHKDGKVRVLFDGREKMAWLDPALLDPD